MNRHTGIGGEAQVLRVSIEPAAHLVFEAWDGSATPQTGSAASLAAAAAPLELSTWTHVSVSVAGTAATLRVNGFTVASGTGGCVWVHVSADAGGGDVEGAGAVRNAADATRSKCELGRGSSAGAAGWHGRIADLRMHSRAVRPRTS